MFQLFQVLQVLQVFQAFDATQKRKGQLVLTLHLVRVLFGYRLSCD
jgi:hypothetical protein